MYQRLKTQIDYRVVDHDSRERNCKLQAVNNTDITVLSHAINRIESHQDDLPCVSQLILLVSMATATPLFNHDAWIIEACTIIVVGGVTAGFKGERALVLSYPIEV